MGDSDSIPIQLDRAGDSSYTLRATKEETGKMDNMLYALRLARPYVACCTEPDGSDGASEALRVMDAIIGVDLHGRAYAKLSQLKAGDKVELDADFDCCEAGLAEVFIDENGELFFSCKCGRHQLDGQADDGEHCIGVYPVPK
jgi:hypothetical protein